MTIPSLTEDLADLRRIIREKQVDEAVREARNIVWEDNRGLRLDADFRRVFRFVWYLHRANEATAVSRFAPSSDAGKRDTARVSDADRILSRCLGTPSSLQRATTEALRAELAARGVPAGLTGVLRP